MPWPPCSSLFVSSLLHAAQRNATQRNATQRNATQRNATQRSATQRNATQRNAAQRQAQSRFFSFFSFFFFFFGGPIRSRLRIDKKRSSREHWLARNRCNGTKEPLHSVCAFNAARALQRHTTTQHTHPTHTAHVRHARSRLARSQKVTVVHNTQTQQQHSTAR